MLGTSLRTVGLWLTLAVIFSASFTVSLAQSGQRSDATSANIVAQRDFGAWKYLAIRDDSGIMITVEVAQKDLMGLKAYMIANAELATRLFQQNTRLEGRVVFKRPVPEKDLPKAIQVASTEVKGYELRARGGKNEKFTIFGAPSASDFLPQDLLAPMLADIRAKSGRAEFKGFTTITVPLSAAQYQELVTAPDVLFVDIAPAAAVEDYQWFFASPSGSEAVTAIAAPSYWYNEETLDR